MQTFIEIVIAVSEIRDVLTYLKYFPADSVPTLSSW